MLFSQRENQPKGFFYNLESLPFLPVNFSLPFLAPFCLESLMHQQVERVLERKSGEEVYYTHRLRACDETKEKAGGCFGIFFPLLFSCRLHLFTNSFAGLPAPAMTIMTCHVSLTSSDQIAVPSLQVASSSSSSMLTMIDLPFISVHDSVNTRQYRTTKLRPKKMCFLTCRRWQW
mmetsp:Transcript_26379/g.51844  ORF Transcript_26379/g.51844 Transcript_26379/m.51844 type:complete len:175 (-) Transcript_26379:1497-2021(-)